MENQRILDTYYYKLPAQEQHQQHPRENQRCRDDLSRVGNMIPLNNSGYGTQVSNILNENYYLSIQYINSI